MSVESESTFERRMANNIKFKMPKICSNKNERAFQYHGSSNYQLDNADGDASAPELDETAASVKVRCRHFTLC